MPKTDKITPLRNRDRGRSPGDTVREVIVDPDAPAAEHHEDHTGEVLASAFRSVEPGSDAERALVSVIDLLSAKHANGSTGGGSGGGGDLTRAFIAKLAAGVLAFIGIVQPTTNQFAERIISPTSALERKLDDVLAEQATTRAQQQEDRAIFIALAKWVVDCELARSQGRSMPEPPAPVRLILVQDELHRSTGP